MKRIAVKRTEWQEPSWKRTLIRLFSGSKNKSPKKIDTEMTEEQKLQYVKGRVSELAPELREPVRLVINREAFWFDLFGVEANDTNKDRFEQMLEEGKIGSLSEREIDGQNKDIELVQGTVVELARITQKPMKINNIWFDDQGAIVSESGFQQFETEFGVNN